ncbi:MULTISPECIES: flagellar hook-basal body complex protein FliE [unclassified Haematospirillum]|uniref:flagellar hook-basal body complex protein FliE n=1 Tax=unclassified Haematospirillum TaxID=2622088 RepID=UPI00143BC019|nr:MULTISPECIES: flagellar hook-basal body complex protein FliE [unclassified Haematospirillum]NKD55840.1 flagellar hook-basal body protein FliE [Haematospirillum sp. H4890]NKD75849.1 flagellar hook-basal body protein FliE [Haematospirillum sp. H4485]NKD87973.1 flagellar hook-basal body protein FliE [Haematospirillum sp. 15-248]
MTNSISSAIQAYRTAARQVLGSATETAETVRTATSSVGAPSPENGLFGDMVRSSLKEAVQVQRTAEAVSLRGIAGEADMRDVVLAVSNAETTLNTVVAIRDRVVSAYQEILKMPI